MDDYFESVFTTPMTRRRLIKGVAAAGAATWIAGSLPARALAGDDGGDFSRFTAIAPSTADALQVPEGYVVDVIISWGDEFAPGLRFGYNCDYSTFFPFREKGDEGLIWVNHEYIVPFFTSDWTAAMNPTWDPRGAHAALMRQEQGEVGGSILHIRRAKKDGWKVVEDSRFARRFSALGPEIPYDGPVPELAPGLLPSSGTVAGTLANCSGAQTPWGTVLSCEENYQSYGLKRGVPLVFSNGWIRDDGSTPEEVNYYIGEPGLNVDDEQQQDTHPYYGYVTEIDPFTGKAVKHTALGRIHHENVGIRIAPGGHVVCYTGDDAPAADGMFFKFVSEGRYRRGMSRSDAMKLLSEGQLYVARWLPQANDPSIDSGTGEWVSLDMRDPEALAFTTKWIETEIVAAKGHELNQYRVPRAEDCEVLLSDERRVLVSLTSARGRPASVDPTAFGLVRLIEEDSGKADSATFRWAELLEGGPHTGFASPDNMAFSGRHDLWVVTDVSSSQLNRPGGAFQWHQNNAIFYVPLRGRNANTAFRFANAPVEAELTGPTFNVRQKTLFLNVQHPGEETPNKGGVVGDPATFTSWWPDGNKTAGTGTPGKPKPSLLAIRKLRGHDDDD